MQKHFSDALGKGWRILCDLQVQRVRVGSGTLLVRRPTKAPNRMAKKIGIIVNDVKEALVVVVTSSRDNADTYC